MPVTLSNVNSRVMDIEIKDKYYQIISKGRSRGGGLEPPTKKLKKMHTQVETLLWEMTELIMVLIGVATLRGGAPPNVLECQLATKLYKKMTSLVTIFAPQDLVPKNVLRSLIRQLVVHPLHPPHLAVAKIVSTQPRSSRILSTSNPSLLQTIATVVCKVPSCATPFSPPLVPPPPSLPSSTTLISLPNAPTPLVSIISSSQTFKSQVPTLKVETTSAVALAASIATPSKPEIVAIIPSNLLEKTKKIEDLQTSITTLEKSMPPLVPPSSILDRNTNVVEGQISSVKWQALSSKDAQSKTMTTMTTMTTISINDQRRSQALEETKEEQGLKNLVSNEPPSIVLDSQQTHKELALAVHLLLKPQITTPGLEKSALKYINIPIACGICKVVVNTTINVLVCDGCECLFHLQCLQLSSNQYICKGDWYCPKCVMINIGRPQAPKFGPLRRGPTRVLGQKNSWSMELFSTKRMPPK